MALSLKPVVPAKCSLVVRVATHNSIGLKDRQSGCF